jgi:hypothetical protein
MNKDEERKSDIKRMKLLAKAIRFNHNKTGKLNVMVDPDYEIEKYQIGMTQLTLPHRFGMYKTPTKDVPKRTEVELEDPPFNVSEALSILERNPNHKVRGIFD